MSTKDTHEQEMDLNDLFDLLRSWFYGMLKHIFNGIAFLLKFWWLILLLLVGSILLGIALQGDPDYKANVVVKINYNSHPYVYNAVEQFNLKLKEKDSAFIRAVGLNPGNPGIADVQIRPIVDIVDLLDRMEVSNRSLEVIIGELDLEDEEELFSSERFYSNYTYHIMEFVLVDEQSKAAIDNLITYINEQPHIKTLVTEGKKNYSEKVMQYDRTIEQMNELIDVYTETASVAVGSSNSLTFFNNPSNINIREIFLSKTEMIETNEDLKNYLFSMDGAAFVISDIQGAKDEPLLKKKYVIYPILILFFFFLIVFMRYAYLVLGRKLNEYQNRQ